MRISIFCVIFIVLSCPSAIADTKFQQLDNGWRALTEQADPFDSSAIKIVQIIKDGFIFQCGELNMAVESSGFDGLSFSAELKYLIDETSAKNKIGKYSTYLGGSDLVTDSRYYSFKLNKEDINAMKSGSSMKVAGTYGGSGWQTKNINLLGFGSAYDAMCNQ